MNPHTEVSNRLVEPDGRTAKRGFRSKAFKAYASVYITFTLGANAVLLIPQSEFGSETSRLFVSSWILVHSICLLFFATSRWPTGSGFFILLFSCFYILLSSLWSPFPAQTLPYSIMLCGNFVFAYMCAVEFEENYFFRFILSIIVFLCIAGVIFWLSGSNHVRYYDTHNRMNVFGFNPIRGFFNHKVVAALYANVGLIIAQIYTRGMIKFALTVILVLFIALTGSATGIALIFTSYILVWWYRFLFSSREPLIWLFVITTVLFVPIASLFYYEFDTVLTALGRDPTLTGRTYLWSWGINAWLERPIFGWGLKGYFLTPNSQAVAQSIIGFQNYDVPHFHQSFIQTAVDFGVGGVILLTLNILLPLYSRFRDPTNRPYETNIVTCALLTMLCFSSLTMFIFYNYNHFATVIILYLLFRNSSRDSRILQSVPK